MLPLTDYTKRRLKPYVNWTLIAINVAVFFYMVLSDRGEQTIFDWGFIAACLGDQLGAHVNIPAREIAANCPPGNKEYLQVLTSMFVHAGWAHIAGNMLFLWIFGDNVEDRMGHGRYLVFYLLCGVIAALTQTFMSLETTVPSVGASGAIAGVMAGYLILYPFGRIRVIVLPFFFLPFVVPAVVLIGIWFAMQLFFGLGDLGSSTAGSGVAYWAHVGGFVAGLVLIWFFKRSQRPWQRAGLPG